MNLWSRFRGLFARETTVTVVTVNSVNANGTSVVQTPTSAPFVVIGDSVTAGNRALVQGGRIIGAAATLPTYTVTV